MLYIFIGILSGFLWGLNDVYTNLLSSHIEMQFVSIIIIFALTLAFLQDFSSSLMLFCYHKSKGNIKVNISLSKPIFKYIFIAAIFAGPCGMVCGIMGITYAGPVYASVVTSCYPVIAMLLSIILLNLKPTKLRIFGVILTILSMILISIEGMALGKVTHIGTGLIFAAIAMFGWGLESVLVSMSSSKSNLSPSWLLCMRQTVSATSYLILLVLFVIFHYSEVIYVMRSLNDSFLIIACVVSALLSYVTYYNTIRNIGPSVGTVFNSTFIFWAAVISAFLGISNLGISFWYLAICLVIGIMFSVYEPKSLKLYLKRA